MQKITIIGPAGSGKSTLAADTYVQLKKMGINAELIPEWVRGDIAKNGPMTSIWEQYRYLHHQRQLEDKIPQQVQVAICDAGVLTSYFYSCLYADQMDSRQRLVLHDMYGQLLEDIYCRRYGYIFYVPLKETLRKQIDLSDGTRYQTQDQIQSLDLHMELTFTRLHRVDNIIVLDCALEERTESILNTLLNRDTSRGQDGH